MNKELAIAFNFPGLGSQKVGMGKKLYDNSVAAREVFEQADGTLEYSVSDLCFNDPGNLLTISTAHAQPAVLTVGLAGYRFLQSEGMDADQVAGHSLGEYTALVAADSIAFDDALRLVEQRGAYMAQESEIRPARMVAILGLEQGDIEDICLRTGAEIANYNCDSQFVIAGEIGAVREASEITLNKKGKVIKLPINVASHCSLAENVRAKMEKLLSGVDIKKPETPVVANMSADYVTTADKVRSALVNQLNHAVLWRDSVRTMIKNGAHTFWEVGPGTVLSNLITRIDPNVKIFSVDKYQSTTK